MKLQELFESNQQLLHLQQLLIDELGDEWDVGVDKQGLTLSNPKFPGAVWFGAVEYHDLHEPTSTKAEVEARVKETYEDIGPGAVKILDAYCFNVNTCSTRVKVKDLTDALRVICIYNGWSDLTLLRDEYSRGELVQALDEELRPA